MSGLVWACCSSRRATLLLRKTIATLHRGNFQSSLYVIVPSEEVIDYQIALRDSPIHTILLHCQRGLTRQRQFLRDQMLPGTEIVWIDDDIEAIKIRSTAGLEHCRNLPALANFIFEAIAAHPDKPRLAGVYPMANPLFQKLNTTQRYAYVVGALYFQINDETPEPEQDELEDWTRCLVEHAAGRPVLRFNWIGIQTQYWKNPGGLQVDRTEAKRDAMVQRIAAEFSSLVKIVTRKNGKPDLKFLKPQEYWSGQGTPDSSPAPPETLLDQPTASEPLAESTE